MASEGIFVWYELMARDVAAAAKFYQAVVGWTITPSPFTTASGQTYWSIGIDGFDMGVGGMIALTAEMEAAGARPAWMGYVNVDDVDAKAQAFEDRGGKVFMPGTDIPNVGRFAVVADPQGAVLYLFKPNMPEGPMPDMPAPGTPGTCGWNELMAADGDAAFAFYADMFGWTKSTAVDMGPMGTYQLFAHEGRDLGGMMTKPASILMPYWGYYFIVPALDPAIASIVANGGTVVNGPMQVPGGSWIVQALDPQGAFFALVSQIR